MNLLADNISFAYNRGNPILNGITIEISAGKIIGIFGRNGSGKSTLIRCLNGALRPQSGNVYIGKDRIDSFTPRQIATRIAIVSQDIPLNVPFTVKEMVMFGRFPYTDFWGNEGKSDFRIAEECLERVGALNLAQRRFDEISGGERQRVLIARALAQGAPILLLDEPASHLDIAHQLEVLKLARKLAKEGYSILLVCHDLVITPMFLDQAILLLNGKIYDHGDPQTVLNSKNLENCFGCRIDISRSDKSTATIKLLID